MEVVSCVSVCSDAMFRPYNVIRDCFRAAEGKSLLFKSQDHRTQDLEDRKVEYRVEGVLQ